MSLDTLPTVPNQDKSPPPDTINPLPGVIAVRVPAPMLQTENTQPSSGGGRDYILRQSPPAIKTSKTVSKTIVEEIQELTGPAVMIPWPPGKKGDKRKWGKYTMEHMSDPAHLARLNDPNANIGIKNGDPSDGLITFDPDSDEAMEEFADLNPICRETLCTRGMDGANYWFRVPCPSGPIINYEVQGSHWGERRGTGGQTIIRGIHPITQKPYIFKQRQPVVTLASADLIKLPPGVVACSGGRRNRTQDTQATQAVQAIQDVQAILPDGAGVVPPFPNELLLPCVPKRKRDSDRNEFELARRVKGWELRHKGEYDLPDKRAIFERWHLLAAAFLQDKKENYWLEFLRGYSNVEFPWGDDKMGEAWKLARSKPPPAKLVENFAHEGIRLLGSLCRELHILWQPKPFYLGCRKAGELLGVVESTAHLWLGALEGAGVIKLVEKGRSIPERGPDGKVLSVHHQASTWRYRLNL